jgi:hypothetical protein
VGRFCLSKVILLEGPYATSSVRDESYFVLGQPFVRLEEGLSLTVDFFLLREMPSLRRRLIFLYRLILTFPFAKSESFTGRSTFGILHRPFNTTHTGTEGTLPCAAFGLWSFEVGTSLTIVIVSAFFGETSALRLVFLPKAYAFSLAHLYNH